jgi:hypothetical protein
MNNYSDQLAAMGLTDLQIGTILSGWSCQGIEALLRGEKEPPSEEGIVEAMLACCGD